MIDYKNIKYADNSYNPRTFREAKPVRLFDIESFGYTFDGWYDSSTDGTRVTGRAAFERADDVTVLARWSPAPVTYTYNANGGKWSDGTAAPKVINGRFEEPVEIPVPKKTGYNFAWDDAVPAAFGVKDKTFRVYLPAINELCKVFKNKETINAALTTLINGGVSAETLEEEFYWSSSSAPWFGVFTSPKDAWVCSSSGETFQTQKHYQYTVRPVKKF